MISYTSANFAFGMMWGGEEAHQLSVLKIEDVLLAVNKAYRDMIQHNVSGLSLKKVTDFKCNDAQTRDKKAILNLKTEKIKELKQHVAEQVVSVFKSGYFSHEALCEDFVTSFLRVIQELNAAIISFGLPDAKIAEDEITYGLAQKIVNMTFKYLYLFDDKEKYESIFKQCHMPLDSYILDYLRSGVDAEWKVDAIKSDDKWSKLEEEDYTRISESILKKCKEQSDDLRYPLFAEFYIWPKALAYAKQKEDPKK